MFVKAWTRLSRSLLTHHWTPVHLPFNGLTCPPHLSSPLFITHLAFFHHIPALARLPYSSWLPPPVLMTSHCPHLPHSHTLTAHTCHSHLPSAPSPVPASLTIFLSPFLRVASLTVPPASFTLPLQLPSQLSPALRLLFMHPSLTATRLPLRSAAWWKP